MGNKILVIGIGPGSAEYVTPIATTKASQCDVLIGGPRALKLFEHLHKETMIIDKNLGTLTEFIKNSVQHKKIGVLVSGDPGFYSMLTYLRKHFSTEQLEVLPGLSSVQVAFSRIGVPWQDAALLSLHGREFEQVKPHIHTDKLAFLTDGEHGPKEIAQYLLDQGVSNRRAVACINISYPDEQIIDTTLKGLAEMGDLPPAVVVVLNE